MRNILFRAEVLGSRKDIIEGSLIDFTDGQFAITSDHKNATWSLVKPDSISQFTGFVDDRNRKIFENDLLEICNDPKKSYRYKTNFVKWDHDFGEWVVFNELGKWGNLSRFLEICKGFKVKVYIKD